MLRRREAVRYGAVSQYSAQALRARLLDWGAPSSYKITARLLSRRDRPLLPLAPWRVVVERAAHLPDWACENNTRLGTVYVGRTRRVSITNPTACGGYAAQMPRCYNGGRTRWTTIDRDPPSRIQGGRWRLIARLWKPGTSVRVRAP